MPNAWDFADVTLEEQLDAWRAVVVAAADLELHLYKNDYTPIAGSAIGDYTEATFDSYAAQAIVATDWGAVAVTAHVAEMQQNTPCVFTAGAGPFTTEDVYGYYVTDSVGTYLWGERFATSQPIEPLATLSVVAVMRHAVAAA